jgi:hypothetical protein
MSIIVREAIEANTLHASTTCVGNMQPCSSLIPIDMGKILTRRTGEMHDVGNAEGISEVASRERRIKRSLDRQTGRETHEEQTVEAPH